MKETKADLLLHPIRMRIVLTLVGGRQLSGLQLAEVLPDVPQATLYRHLNKLAKGGILQIVEQRQVRGAVEKVYAVLGPAVNITPEEAASATRDDHLRYFTMFVAGLLGTFERYLERDHIDMLKDGVGYRQVPLYLSDAEFLKFQEELSRVVLAAYGNQPAPERQRRILTTIVMPESQHQPPKEE
jgi:DNA-binding transcriptional ArsR family regulator